jgi:hypothetical protein
VDSIIQPPEGDYARDGGRDHRSHVGIGRVDQMIAVVAIIVASIATMMLVALICVAVYDPAQMLGMSLKQRAAFCLRQLGSSWPWR